MRRLALLLLLWGLGLAGGSGAAEPPPAEAPAAGPVTLEANFAAGSSTLFSVPLDLGGLDLGDYLAKAGLSSKGIHGWDPQAQNYVPLTTIRPGQGFLLARGPGKISFTGHRVAAEAVELVLSKGWNLIAVPYEGGVPLASLRITLEGKTESYLSAVEKKWAGGVNSLFEGKTSALVAETALLEPWRGYWLYAYQPCHLSIPSPETLVKKKPAAGKRPAKR